MKHFFLTIFSIVFLLMLFSCKKETEIAVEMGYKYFPINVGHWVVYDVDSFSYNDFTGKVDSFRFQIKEKIESVFNDNENRPTQRIERYKRLNDTSEWYIKDVWTQNLTSTTAERTEENIRIVKLIFPPSEGIKWDGNKYNALGEQSYVYKNIHSAYNLNHVTYDSTLSIIQKEEHLVLNENFEKEVYAAHIGMIYKKYTKLTKQPTGVILSGIDYSYTLTSYGN